jgi:hypothetical protein
MNLKSKEPIIYLIGGKARTGKTTLKSLIEEEYKKNAKQVASMMYANYIKVFARDYFGWDGKEETKSRELLQKLGTEVIRFGLNKPCFLINRLCEDIEILSNFFDVIIVDDVRIKEEIEIPKSKFKNVISIKMIRKETNDNLTEEQKHHYTEVGLDNYNNFDYIISNDSSIEELKKIAEKLVIIKE